MNKSQVKKREKIVCLGLFAVLVSLVGFYLYLISASVLHVVMHSETQQKIRTEQSLISELERDYIEAQHKVSASIASLQGYAPPTRKVFLSRAPSSLVLNTAEE